MSAEMAEAQDLKKLRNDTQAFIQKAIDFTWSCQQSDGHWNAPVSADATFTAQYVMFKYAILGLSLAEDGAALRQWLLSDQGDDGSWSMAPRMPGNVSTSVEAYLALRLLDVPLSHPAMERARAFILRQGGVAKVRFFTRFFLATFGLVPWAAIPQMPAELILMPTWAFLNVYVLSSWSRSTLIPILVVRHHEPVYALPNGLSKGNDFLDELWCDPTYKHVPYTRPLWELCWGRNRDAIELAFTLADKALVQLGGLRRWPLRKLAIRRCVEWLLEHQEEQGDWAGFFPPMHGSVWALILEGFPLHHKAVSLGLEAMERLAVNDSKGKWLQPTVSPCWDTALMVNALCDAGCSGDSRLVQAVDWLKARQLMVTHGDWRLYANTQQAGGWSFEYYNTFYPDVDDTAVIVMVLLKQDPSSIQSECVENAIEWILGLQNRDGGWGAFDINNDARWLHKIPFSDMDSLVDPSTSDVTGRMLECFGLLLAHRKGGRLRPWLRYRIQAASRKALLFLFDEQEISGAESGAWWGRWGNNFNYGTTNVLRGLAEFAHHDPRVRNAVRRAIQWLDDCQNEDGGWGEDLLSYADRNLAGRGTSTAAQTAWTVDSLLHYRHPSDQAIQNGINWLILNQNPVVEEQKGATWPTELYVGTGFPNVLYLGYPFYHHIFPIQALSRYLDHSSYQKADMTGSSLQLTSHVVSELSRPSVVLMVIGTRGDIEVFLSIAKRLHGYRVRIATHPAHFAIVAAHGYECYDIGGSPDEFARVLGNNPNILFSIVNGNLATLCHSMCNMFRKLWQASYDDSKSSAESFLQENDIKRSNILTRPFVADFVVSSPATEVHISAAEKLQVPLVFVSAQPVLPTREFPHVFTMTKPSFSPDRWLNHVTYVCLEVLEWLTFSSFLNNLRVREYNMRPLFWFRRSMAYPLTIVPHICLWSPNILFKPAEWPSNVTIAGYTAPIPSAPFDPPACLQSFLQSPQPIIPISFGSMFVPNPGALLSILSSALTQIKALAIFNRSWPACLEVNIPIPSNIYVTRSIPHDWLLPRVSGFIHHGGAGHTAAGLRAGVPMLIMPFLLDQFFWAAKVHELGLGPAPLTFRNLELRELVPRLQQLLSGSYQKPCVEMAVRVKAEGDGADIVADAVRRQGHLPGFNEPCAMIPALGAHWRHSDSGLLLSGAAAAGLVESEVLGWDDLDLRPRIDWEARWEDADASRRWLVAVNRVAITLSYVLGTLHAILLWLSGFKESVEFAEEARYMAKRKDPVRRVRVRQAEYDWQLVRRDVDGKGAAALGEGFVSRWRPLAAARFRERLGGDGMGEL